jgi:hypothetical protein
MNSKPIRPSRLGYAVAGGLLAVAMICIVFAVAGFISMDRQIQHFQRVAVPGETQVTFTEPGRYLVYMEGPGMADDHPAPAHVTVRLEPVNGGPPISVESTNGQTSYQMGGYEGRSVGSFRIGQPGVYRLSADGPTSPSITHVAVGGSIVGDIAVSAVLIVAAILVGLASLAVGVITAVRRNNARRATPEIPV